MAGIYHNAELGVISMSSDGTNWLTIADKNLGATQVYNAGDTLSEANSGKFYQWGNNYGFPFTGSVTTSSTQVDASAYGPTNYNYYESDTFIEMNQDWSSVYNDNLRGWVIGTNEAMRGPAPDGFHVPLSTEWQGLNTIMSGLGLTTGDNRRINLHMPFVGYRNYSTSDLLNQGSNGIYWSSSPYGSDYPSFARTLNLNSSTVNASSGTYRANGFPVRCFKDTFEIPTASWTVINGTLGSAGIFWDTVNGLISITSDGSTGYTIQDKNLGATTVYNDGDTLTQANMGNMYQWGNNYGFPSTGSVSKVSTTQVNASSYGVTDYYSSSTFITRSSSPWDWSSVQNDNLRGDTTNTNEARKGPSSTGFHVPSITEWQGLKTIMDGLSLTTGDNWKTYLYLSFAGYRKYSTADLTNQGSDGNYWSSSPYESEGPYYARYLGLNSSSVTASYASFRVSGFSVRPFANTPVVPDYTWERLYGDELPAPKNYIKRFQNNGNYYYFGDAPTHATGVTLNKSSLALTEAGQTEQLVATVTPSDAVEKSVTWTSSDTTVARVYQDGTVECVNPGECTITCTVNDGGYTASCAIDKNTYIDFLIVGGGGGGGALGCISDGGGGGGGIIECIRYNINLQEDTFNVTVGAGGNGDSQYDGYHNGCSGGDSCFLNFIAYGGGYGGHACKSSRGTNGGNGGSGGGGSAGSDRYYYGGSGCTGQGNNGGNGCVSMCGGSGGGGGYSSAGCAGALCKGGDGGLGYDNCFNGICSHYSYGGGGGAYGGDACRGCGHGYGGDGGRAVSVESIGGDATTYGSGGGGKGYTDYDCGRGGNGCQGIVIIRYPVSGSYGIRSSCGGDTCRTCTIDGVEYCIHEFTSDGIFCVIS